MSTAQARELGCFDLYAKFGAAILGMALMGPGGTSTGNVSLEPGVQVTGLDPDDVGADDDDDDRFLPRLREVRQTRPPYHLVQRSPHLAGAVRKGFYPSSSRWTGDNACGACAGAMALDRLLRYECHGPACVELGGMRAERLSHWIDRAVGRTPEQGIAPLPLARAIEQTARASGAPNPQVQFFSFVGPASGIRPEQLLFVGLQDASRSYILGLSSVKRDENGIATGVESEGGHYVLATGYERVVKAGPDRVRLFVSDSESNRKQNEWSLQTPRSGPLLGKALLDSRWVISEILEVHLGKQSLPTATARESELPLR